MRLSDTRTFFLEFLLPLRPQLRARDRIALFEKLGRDHAIGAEVAKAFAHLAPRHDETYRLEIADGERPDHPSCFAALLVAIEQRDLALRADRRAHARH